MKEPSLENLTLPRLLELQRAWRGHAKAALEAGRLNLAASLTAKLDLIAPLIAAKQGENLNDLFA